MKKETPYFYKQGAVKYVRLMRKLFTALSCVALPVFMVLLVFAFNGTAHGKPIFFSAAAVVLIGYFIAYGFYTMRVSLGTVLGIETTNEVVHLHTARKTYTYDVRMGCVGVKEHRNRFVAVFRTQDSRDNFTFYKHAPFSSFSDGQFSSGDISRFFSDLPEDARG